MAGRTRANPKGAATKAKESPPAKPAAGRRNVKAEETSPAKAQAPVTPKKVPVTPRKTPAIRTSSRKGGGGAIEEVEVTKFDLSHEEEELHKADKKSTAAAAKKGKPEKSKADGSVDQDKQPTSNHVTAKKSSVPAPAPAQPSQSRKEAEREKRKNSAVVKEGSSIVCAMPEEDMTTFLDRLSSQLSPTDVKSHLARATSIKWDRIAFGMYTANQLKVAWQFLKGCTRSYRIMLELVNEIKLTYSNTQFKYKLLEALPGFPQSKRFLSAFHLYLKDKWNRRTQEERDKFPTWLNFQVEYKKGFDALSDAEKKHWEQETVTARAEHEAQVAAYFEEHPEFAGFKEIYDAVKAEEVEPKKKKKSGGGGGSTGSKAPRQPRVKASKESTEADFPDAPVQPMNPQALYINSRLKKLNLDPLELDENLTEHKLRFSEKWNGLKDKKKAKWINRCVEKCEQYRDAVLEFQATHPGYRPPAFKLVHKVSRPEMEIWAVARGMPERPAYTVTEKLQKELLEEDEANRNLTPTELKQKADKKLVDMSDNDRELYKVRFKQAVLMYRKEIAEFYNKVPDVAKPILYSTIPKKFREGLRLPGEAKNESEDAELALVVPPTPGPADADEESRPRNEPKSLIPGPSPKAPSVRYPVPVPLPVPTWPSAAPVSKSKPAKPSSAPRQSPPKKRPTSSEFVEDSSSGNSNEAVVVVPPSPKKKKFTSDVERFNLDLHFQAQPQTRVALPKLNASPPRPFSATTAERSSSHSKKKKKHAKKSESDSDSESSEDRRHKKKKKHVEPEKNQTAPAHQTKGKNNRNDSSEDEDDEEEADRGYRQGHGRLPPFPVENIDRGHAGEISRSSSSGSSEDEEEDSSSSTEPTASSRKKMVAGGAGPSRTSKEYRDQQIEKYQKKFSSSSR